MKHNHHTWSGMGVIEMRMGWSFIHVSNVVGVSEIREECGRWSVGLLAAFPVSMKLMLGPTNTSEKCIF